MDNTEVIETAYQRRKTDPSLHGLYRPDNPFYMYSRMEREFVATTWLHRLGLPVQEQKVLEIGAGAGDNLLFLKRIGYCWKRLFANELLPDRVHSLETFLPHDQILPGDALLIPETETYDLILAFTVFSSLLDPELRKAMAQKSVQLLAKGGHLLWYDFIYNNPKNKDVVGIPQKEALELFSDLQLVAKKSVTLAPPIGRRVGGLYNLTNTLFPFFRSHRLLLFKKDA